MIDSKTDIGIAEVLLDNSTIQVRLRELAVQIESDYANRQLLMVGILKGSFVVMADLLRYLSLPVCIDFMAVSSYGSGVASSGRVRMLKDLDEDIAGRDVLVVEDIIDTGLTLQWLIGLLASRKPASLEICALLRKPNPKLQKLVRYVGFEIPDKFVVGYGLDWAERYRNLGYIGVLSPEVYS